MNLLLVEPGEVTDGAVVIADRRAEHLRGVLGVVFGSHVRAGIVGGGIGTAEVIADDGLALTLRLAIAEPAPPALPIELVLAVPRPKVLTRVVEAAAAFGVARIALTNAWRVDKSYLKSPRLAPEALALATRLGAEQGATTHLPPIAIHHRLMELLDLRWPAPRDRELVRADRPELRLIAHPGGVPIEDAYAGTCEMPIEDARWPARPDIDGRAPGSGVPADSPITIAIGPEGGWIAREVETFVARGFVAVSLGTTILRVETAVAAALGQLVLLERVRPISG